jgi:flavin-dependent dehydrogenase
LKQNISKEETTEILNSDAMHSYQVNRYIFDKILVDRAKELGVEFIENTKVIDLIYE